MSLRSSFADLPALLKFSLGNSTAFERLARFAGTAWSWWTTELLSMTPPIVREWMLERLPKMYLIEGDGCEVATREYRVSMRSSSRPNIERRSISWAQAAGTLAEHTRVIVVLPETSALITEALLPPASTTSLRAAAALQLERHVPFRPDDVYFDVSRTSAGSDGAAGRSKIAVLPRRKLDPIIDSLTQRKLIVTQVRLRLADGTLDDRFNFGWSLRRFARTWPAREQIATVTLALTLCIIAAFMVERRWEGERTALETEIGLRAVEATVARKLDQEIEAAERRVAAVRQNDNALTVLNLLEHLAQRLPDSAWLETLSFRPEQIVFAGFGRDTAAVASALETSPYLPNVGLRDLALAANGAEVERFEIQSSPGAKR